MSISRCLSRILVAVAMLAAPASAQPRPEFDVASLKPAVPHPGDTADRININLGMVRNGRVTTANTSLSDCLRLAFDITSDAQIVGPDWIKDKNVRFDIEAKAPSDTKREVLLVM